MVIIEYCDDLQRGFSRMADFEHRVGIFILHLTNLTQVEVCAHRTLVPIACNRVSSTIITNDVVVNWFGLFRFLLLLLFLLFELFLLF